MQNISINFEYRKFRSIFLFGSISLNLVFLIYVQFNSDSSLGKNLKHFKQKEPLIFKLDCDENVKNMLAADDYYNEYRLRKQYSNQDMKLNGGGDSHKDLDQPHEMENLHDEVVQILMLIPADQRTQLIESFPRPKSNHNVAGANILKLYEPPPD